MKFKSNTMEINMKRANLTNYLNLLNDVYDYGTITTALCRKYKISNQTTKTLKELKYADKKGKSIMIQRPNINDVKKVLNRNNEIAQKHYSNTLNKYKTINKQIEKIPIVKNNKIEINLFWGMIKILK